MPRRLVSVDDSFNLPASVKAVDANLPARLQDAALSATILDGIETGAAVQKVSQHADAERGLDLGKLGVVLKMGTGGAFDAGVTESPVVWWDDNEQMYMMVYVGYNAAKTYAKVGLAYALRPEGPWTKKGVVFEGSFVGGSPDATGTSGPVIYKEGNTYYLWYIGLPDSGYEAGTKRACLAKTTVHPMDWTPASWTRLGAKISPTQSGAANDWIENAIYHVHPVKRGNTYYLFFNARGNPNFHERIGLATAPSMEGPWTVDPRVLLETGGGGSWEEHIINDPSVYRVGDIWYMAYGGANATPVMSGDGVAWTTNAAFPWGPDGVGTQWRKHHANPILKPGTDAAAFDKNCGKPYILVTPQRHYHYYTAVAASGAYEIALAVSPYRYVQEAITIPELAAARATTDTAFAFPSQTGFVFDGTGKAGLQGRLTVRGNTGTDSMDVKPNMGTAGTAMQVHLASAGAGWVQGSSPWVDLSGWERLFNQQLVMRSVGGANVQLASATVEFRWVV